MSVYSNADATSVEDIDICTELGDGAIHRSEKARKICSDMVNLHTTIKIFEAKLKRLTDINDPSGTAKTVKDMQEVIDKAAKDPDAGPSSPDKRLSLERIFNYEQRVRAVTEEVANFRLGYGFKKLELQEEMAKDKEAKEAKAKRKEANALLGSLGENLEALLACDDDSNPNSINSDETVLTANKNDPDKKVVVHSRKDLPKGLGGEEGRFFDGTIGLPNVGGASLFGKDFVPPPPPSEDSTRLSSSSSEGSSPPADKKPGAKENVPAAQSKSPRDGNNGAAANSGALGDLGNTGFEFTDFAFDFTAKKTAKKTAKNTVSFATVRASDTAKAAAGTGTGNARGSGVGVVIPPPPPPPCNNVVTRGGERAGEDIISAMTFDESPEGTSEYVKAVIRKIIETDFNDMSVAEYVEEFGNVKSLFDALADSKLLSDYAHDMCEAIYENDSYKDSLIASTIRDNILEGYLQKAYVNTTGPVFVLPLKSPSDHYTYPKQKKGKKKVATKKFKSKYCGDDSIPLPPKKTICHIIGRTMIYLGLLSDGCSNECVDPDDELFKGYFVTQS